ncbi:MAG: hypothetical protein LQ340_002790 [Diploschistes diacapsis]|nr:MAG: hypothetical protein LQ340_002790 [Diploschistes diacapsis]
MATPVRPGPSPIASPRTPQRGISSTFSSPGSFRPEDDAVIFEFGSRYLRAGYAGDSLPRCTLGFGPEESRRLGDYRRWLPGYEDRVRQAKKLEDWAADYELWRLDLRETDLGLVEDKIERAVRDAYSRVLVLDSKSRKAMLIVPPSLPHALLSTILSLLFHNFQLPTVTLLPPPTMAVVAAGQRSGLVVDIGWHETRVTIVYELREVREYRSVRGMKLLVNETGKLLRRTLDPSASGGVDEEMRMTVDFSYVEELLTRVIWCQKPSVSTLEDSIKDPAISGNNAQRPRDDSKISMRLPPPSDWQVEIPFSSLSKPVETALFAEPSRLRDQDDHEHPLHYLLYEALVSLPHDIRSVCMSRIMFTGGGANIPGLKTRLLDELINMVKERGWDPVWGKAAEEQRRRRAEQAKAMEQRKWKIRESATKDAEGDDEDSPPRRRAAFEDQEPDPLQDKLRQRNAKRTKSSVSGVIRGLETLGPWAGASITAALKVKSAVEIDRDVFLQHGLAGAKRHTDVVPPKPKSHTATLARMNMTDSGTWTLGTWA